MEFLIILLCSRLQNPRGKTLCAISLIHEPLEESILSQSNTQPPEKSILVQSNTQTPGGKKESMNPWKKDFLCSLIRKTLLERILVQSNTRNPRGKNPFAI